MWRSLLVATMVSAAVAQPTAQQCGDRIVDAGGGTIADARADGTEANGVHDVSASTSSRRST